jgi:ABC-type multidrug transport system fused ATPase/permease subunit
MKPRVHSMLRLRPLSRGPLESLPITRIAIAHRLSTIESADQIAVIQNGIVSELGTYCELSRTVASYLQRGGRE